MVRLLGDDSAANEEEEERLIGCVRVQIIDNGDLTSPGKFTR